MAVELPAPEEGAVVGAVVVVVAVATVVAAEVLVIVVVVVLAPVGMMKVVPVVDCAEMVAAKNSDTREIFSICDILIVPTRVCRTGSRVWGL